MKPQAMLIFDKIQELYTSLGFNHKPIDANCEFIMYNLGDYPITTPYSSPVHRANFFSFAFVKNATGKYSSGKYDFDTKPGTIYFTNPGHVNQFSLTDIKEFYCIMVSEAFLKENIYSGIIHEHLFLLTEIHAPLYLDDEKFFEFEQLYRHIKRVYDTRSPLRNKLIGYLFVLILLKIKEHLRHNDHPVYEGSRQSGIVNNFKVALERHYQAVYNGMEDRAFSIREYARSLGMSPNYLNSIISISTGRCVKAWIIEKTIVECKFLLRHSTLSIKEIAYRLGFAEPAHLSKYFKKYTQTTALEYRQKHLHPS